MSRPTSKEDLIILAKKNWENLNLIIQDLSTKELDTPFDFSKDVKKREAHWQRDRCFNSSL